MTEDDAGTDAVAWEEPARRDERRLDHRAGAGALGRTDALKDESAHSWGVVTPAATRIGSRNGAGPDEFESLRRLHEERHPAMRGHGERMHRLDKAKITQALCGQLSVTPWQRDRAIGIMRDLDLTVFGSQRAIEKVALVVIRYVVDRERKAHLGLDDEEWLATLTPAELESMYDRFQSIKDESTFESLLDAVGLGKTSLNRLHRKLRDEIVDQGLQGVAYGRNPNRDPNLPDLERPRDAARPAGE